jgi:hypothetical protein
MLIVGKINLELTLIVKEGTKTVGEINLQHFLVKLGMLNVGRNNILTYLVNIMIKSVGMDYYPRIYHAKLVINHVGIS